VGDVMSEIAGPLASPAGDVVAHADDTLRHVAYAMAEHGVTQLLVVDRDDHNEVVGTITLEQLLQGRLHDLQEERHSERVLRAGDLIGLGRADKRESPR
jgi:CBS domain-containing protein